MAGRKVSWEEARKIAMSAMHRMDELMAEDRRHEEACLRKARYERLRNAMRKARRVVRMVQGTMGLEGQALDREQLRKIKRMTAIEILGEDG
jgi:hypothetical protein